MTKPVTNFRDSYPNLAKLIDDGCEVQINGRAGPMRICAILDNHQIIAVFPKGRLRVDGAMSKLERLADEYINGGWINDELNGERIQVD